MPRALITGGGSKFGAAFVKELEKTHEVEIIPRAVLKGIGQKYNARHDSYDLVFFNHHAFPEAFDVPTYEQNCLVNLRHLMMILTAVAGLYVLSLSKPTRLMHYSIRKHMIS